MKNKKVIFIVNHLAFFVSHRISVTKELLKNNNKIKVISGNSASLSMEKLALKEIKKKKIDHQILSYSSSKINILNDIIGIVNLIFIINKFKPDIIHCISAKGLLIGFISSYFFRACNRVISISGVGNFFLEKKIKSRIVKFIYIKLINFFKKNNDKFIVQNKRDKKLIIKNFNVKKKNVILFNGSGVDIVKFKPSKVKQRKKIVLFPARAVVEKGLFEFIAASNYLKKKFPNWNFVVAGTLDYRGPGQLSKTQLNMIKNNRNLIFTGHQKNLLKLLKVTSIICLPSYNEGLSKSLIEALFMKIPIITTNVSGCRELVKDKKTGYLIPKKNISLLIEKLEKLILNKKLRLKMINSYKLFDLNAYEKKTIVSKHLKLYESFF